MGLVLLDQFFGNLVRDVGTQSAFRQGQFVGRGISSFFILNLGLDASRGATVGGVLLIGSSGRSQFFSVAVEVFALGLNNFARFFRRAFRSLVPGGQVENHA